MRTHSKIWIGGVIAAVAVVAVLWFILGYWLDITSRLLVTLHWSIIVGNFLPNGLNIFMATWLFYLIGGIALVGLSYVVFSAVDRKLLGATLAGIGAVSLIAALIVAIVAIPQKEASYAGETTVVVEDIDRPPASLNYLLETTNTTMDSACDQAGMVRGISTCIVENEIDLNWESRPASVTAAKNKFQRASEGDNRSYIITESVNYSRTDDGNYWSAIRDGSRKKPIDGVMTWDGVANAPSKCEFSGDNELNYAFNGTWGTNLADLIAKKYHNHLWNADDMWGYCDGDKPVIAIPTSKREGHQHVATDRFGGLLLVTGSPSGEPVFTLVSDVKPGEYPGPVYPSSLAANQRESFNMSAGVIDNWFRGFGMAPSSVSSQAGNSSEFLLESATDGRLYWVTPLRPESTDSEQITTYSVIPADEATSGKLNHQTLYVLTVESGKVVNLATMEDRVRGAVNRKEPGFFGDSGGNLVEFLPLSATTWQVFGERGGIVEYKATVNIDESKQPEVIKLSGESGTPVESDEATSDQPVGESALNCQAEAAAMSVGELNDCSRLYLDELARRAG